MKITILGAGGKTGVVLVAQALEAGHDVVGLVRQGETLPENPKLQVVTGDATKPQDVAAASKGSDAIISTLGTTDMKSTLMTDAVKAVIAASETTGVKRFILMSSFAVAADRLHTAMKVMTKMMQGMINDKSTSEDLLRNSGLDWTIVYATRLNDQPKGSGMRVVPPTEKIGMTHTIARADVAAWMLQEAQSHAHSKQDVLISQ